MRKIIFILLTGILFFSCSDSVENYDVSSIYGEYDLSDGLLVLNSSRSYFLTTETSADGESEEEVELDVTVNFSQTTGTADVVINNSIVEVSEPSFTCTYGTIASTEINGSGTLTPSEGSQTARHIIITSGSSTVKDIYKTTYTGISFTTGSKTYQVYIRDPNASDTSDEKDESEPIVLKGNTVMLYFKKPVTSSDGSSSNSQSFYIKHPSGTNYGCSDSENDRCIWPENTPVYAFKSETEN
ncbi:hypothetical protein DYE49_08435 [Treponema rectale]|uniref:Lipoprotein n=1 Tax=Treponema rectale TaxID=744512 RepID=A0A840SAR1_9SPIR|nr:hypothetical protein [Treponema rectale]MBB5217790.1 hypothetical protein [Treponema rectale]QOS40483.1 hypothetical protein DYE49_08435 [Treponema rectale]